MDKLNELLAQLDKLLKDGLAVSDLRSVDQLCGCGSKNDAIDTAFKMIEKGLGHDCLLWQLQVFQATHVIMRGLLASVLGVEAGRSVEAEIFKVIGAQIISDKTNMDRVLNLAAIAMKIPADKKKEN